MENIILIIISSVIAIYLNLVASYHVLCVDTLAKNQRILQLMLTWLIPIFGSIIVVCFHLSDKDYVKEQKNQKAISNKFINLITLVAFTAGSGGSVVGIHDVSSGDYGGFDSGSGDGGGCGGGDG